MFGMMRIKIYVSVDFVTKNHESFEPRAGEPGSVVCRAHRTLCGGGSGAGLSFKNILLLFSGRKLTIEFNAPLRPNNCHHTLLFRLGKLALRVDLFAEQTVTKVIKNN